MTRAELARALESAKLTWSNGNANLRVDTDERTAREVHETTGVGSVREHRKKHRWYVSSAVDIEAILRATGSDTWAESLEQLQQKLSTSRAGYRLPKTSLAPRVEKTVDPEELAWARGLIQRLEAAYKRGVQEGYEDLRPKPVKSTRIQVSHKRSELSTNR